MIWTGPEGLFLQKNSKAGLSIFEGRLYQSSEMDTMTAGFSVRPLFLSLKKERKAGLKSLPAISQLFGENIN